MEALSLPSFFSGTLHSVTSVTPTARPHRHCLSSGYSLFTVHVSACCLLRWAFLYLPVCWVMFSRCSNFELLATQTVILRQASWAHVTAYEECRVPGPAPTLLDQNLHFNDVEVCFSGHSLVTSWCPNSPESFLRVRFYLTRFLCMAQYLTYSHHWTRSTHWVKE